MYAVEFQTKIKDGMIEIPPEYRQKLAAEVRVIVLSAGQEIQTSLSALDVLSQSPGQQIFHTAEEVDTYLQEERNSWGD